MTRTETIITTLFPHLSKVCVAPTRMRQSIIWQKMLYAGEDVKFIARRIMILASEDIGNADPQALCVATAAAQAVERVGMPESQIILSQAVTYMACAPKSNSAVNAIQEAMRCVKAKKTTVPVHLQDAHYGGHESLGHGIGYKYAHDYPNHYVKTAVSAIRNRRRTFLRAQ